MQALPNPGGLFLPPDHLQGGYVQQIQVFFTEPVDNSDEIVFHNAPPLGPWPTGMGSLRHFLYLHSTGFDMSKARGLCRQRERKLFAAVRPQI